MTALCYCRNTYLDPYSLPECGACGLNFQTEKSKLKTRTSIILIHMLYCGLHSTMLVCPKVRRSGKLYQFLEDLCCSAFSLLLFCLRFEMED